MKYLKLTSNHEKDALEVPDFELIYCSLGTFPDHGSIAILNLQILLSPTVPKSTVFEETFFSLIVGVGL